MFHVWNPDRKRDPQWPGPAVAAGMFLAGVLVWFPHLKCLWSNGADHPPTFASIDGRTALGGTLIGTGRRSALLGTRWVSVGETVRRDGEVWRVSGIETRIVRLTRGDEELPVEWQTDSRPGPGD